MLKNIKRVAFLSLVAVFAFFLVACNEAADPTKEICNELFPCEVCETCEECPTCPTCPTCPDLTEEQCNEKWPITEEQCNESFPQEECPTCPEPEDPTEEECTTLYPPKDPSAETCEDLYPHTQDYAIPTSFEWYGNSIAIGETFEIEIESLEPENAIRAFTYVSSNPAVATVSPEGVVTGIKPGSADITVTAIYDTEVSYTDYVTVTDPIADEIELLKREVNYIKEQLPKFATANFAFPTAWNEEVKVTYYLDGTPVEGFEVPANLDADVKLNYRADLEYGSAADSFTFDLYAVKDAQVNDYVRVQTAITAAEAVLKSYILNVEKVTTDLVLPKTVFGVNLSWDSENEAVIADDGTYNRPADDKAIKLSVTPSYGSSSDSKAYTVIAAGYSADEKMAYIFAEGSLATIAGKATSTNLVLPARDGKFGVALSYKSGNAAIIDDSGKIVAYPAEATAVEFTVTASYDRVANSGLTEFNFANKEYKFSVTVNPANAASAAANAFATQYNLDTQLYFPYGDKNRPTPNTLDLPTSYTHEGVDYAVTYAVDEENFELNTDGKPVLLTQYLRYTESRITAKFASADASAELGILLNIGVSTDSNTAYLGWRNTEQRDTTITPSAGLYDVVMATSYFDKAVGNPKSSYNSPNGASTWSGYSIAVTDANGQRWEDFVLAAMTIYVELDADGNVYYNNYHYAGSYIGQTNWGKFFVNNTGRDIKVAVGTYASGNDADGNLVAEYAGATARTGNAFDGYAIGFVADATGKVLVGSEQAKLQNYIPCSKLTTNEDGTTTGRFPALARFSTTNPNGNGDVYMEEIDTTVEGFTVPTYKDGTYVAPYVTIPAGGFAMSWKYQFYGVGSPTTRYAFCAKDAQISLTSFNLHPNNSIDAIQAKASIDAMKDDATMITEARIATARSYYDKLATDQERAYAGDIVAIEKALAAKLDGEITALVAAYDNNAMTDADLLPEVDKLKVRVDALDARIAQHIANGAELTRVYDALSAAAFKISLDYAGGHAKDYTEAETADRFTSLFYFAETTETVLPIAERTDFIFLGWHDAEGKKVEKVLGSEAADKSFTAKWIHVTEQYINDALAELAAAGEVYTPMYLPAYTGHAWSSNGVDPTFLTHLAQAGIGSKVIIVDGRMFLLGKGSLINLDAKNLPEGLTTDLSGAMDAADIQNDPTRNWLRPYGNSTQDSNGIILVGGEPTCQNSYGFGALYYNSGEETLKIAVNTLYGRNLGGVNFGYQKVQFVQDPATGKYVGKVLGAKEVVELKPGEYIWAPMSAERFGYGLCWGGTVALGNTDNGALYDGVNVIIRDFDNLVPTFEVNYNLNGGWFNYDSVAAIKNDFLADYNAYSGTAYTVDDMPTGSWSPVNFHSFIYENMGKWGWIVEYFKAVSKSDTAKGAFNLIYDSPAAVAAYHDGQYFVSYEIRSWIRDVVIRPGTDFETTNYTDDVDAQIFTYLAFAKEVLMQNAQLPTPIKTGFTFEGWYTDAELTVAAPAIVTSELTVYAKWAPAA